MKSIIPYLLVSDRCHQSEVRTTLRNDKKEAAQQKSERAHKKGGRRQNKGKVDLQERRKDRPSFLLLALPTCQTQIHLNIPPFGVLASKCSNTWGLRVFLRKHVSFWQDNQKQHLQAHGSVIWSWCWWRLFAHGWRSHYSWAKMLDVTQCNTVMDV